MLKWTRKVDVALPWWILGIGLYAAVVIGYWRDLGVEYAATPSTLVLEGRQPVQDDLDECTDDIRHWDNEMGLLLSDFWDVREFCSEAYTDVCWCDGEFNYIGDGDPLWEPDLASSLDGTDDP